MRGYIVHSDVIFQFQSDLGHKFPNLDSVEQHKEVLRFACSLSDHVANFISKYLTAASKLSPKIVKLCFEILVEQMSNTKSLCKDLCDDLTNMNHPTDLTNWDIESLTAVLISRKQLILNSIAVTGLLKLLNEPDHPGFPCLEMLSLARTQLNQEDVESLSEAVRAGKLPQLKLLDLSRNDLMHMEREVEALIAACDALHCEKRVWFEGLSLSLWDT